MLTVEISLGARYAKTAFSRRGRLNSESAAPPNFERARALEMPSRPSPAQTFALRLQIQTKATPVRQPSRQPLAAPPKGKARKRCSTRKTAAARNRTGKSKIQPRRLARSPASGAKTNANVTDEEVAHKP